MVLHSSNLCFSRASCTFLLKYFISYLANSVPFSPPTEISAEHDLENEHSDSVPVSVPVHFGGIIGIVRNESKLLCLEVELWSKARKKSFIFLSVHDGVWSYKDRNNYFDLYLLQKHLNDLYLMWFVYQFVNKSCSSVSSKTFENTCR